VNGEGVAISLFSGADGLDLGAERAGYEVRAAVEWDRDAAATMEKNFGHLVSPVIQRDILQTPTPEILAEARPHRFVLENVYALTYNNTASRPAFQRLMHEIGEAGYHCRAAVLNAADYGVPQSRPRLFVIGVPKDEPLPDLPGPTHGGPWERRISGDPRRPHVTAGKALAGVTAAPEPDEQVNGKYGHLLAAIPPGDNYLFYTERRGHPEPLFRWRGKYWSFLLKLSPDRPSPTIQAQPGPYVGPFHWDNRRLRVAEIKRLFGYPDDFELVGSRASIQAQLGNSVPPALAETVIRALGAGAPG